MSDEYENYWQSAQEAALRSALLQCRTVLANMAQEREGFWNSLFGRRWPVSHEPLRNDARNVLQAIDRALKTDPNKDAMHKALLSSCADTKSCRHIDCVCEVDPTEQRSLPLRPPRKKRNNP